MIELSFKIGALRECYRGVDETLVVCLVIRAHRVIDAVLCEGGVERSWLSIVVKPMVIIEAIGDVGRLLYFDELASTTDGVYSSGWQEEAVLFVYGIVL